MEFESIFTTAQFELNKNIRNTTKKSSIYESRSFDGAAMDSITKSVHESVNGTLSMEADASGLGLLALSGRVLQGRKLEKYLGNMVNQA